MRTARLLTSTSFLSILALAGRVAAQNEPAADALFNKGLEDMKAGKYETGCPALAQSFQLDPKPGALFTLADCENMRGHIATAVVHYREFLARVDVLPVERKATYEERQARAKEQIEALTPQIPTLTLILPKNAPAGTVVKQDGEVFAGPSLGVPLPVDPGEHIVTTQAPGGPGVEVKIQITKGEKKQIHLEVKPVATPVAPATGSAALAGPTPDKMQRPKVPVWAWIAGGVGVVSAGASIAFGVDFAQVKDKTDQFSAKYCTSNICPKTHSAEMSDLEGHWNQSLTLTLLFAGIGAAGLGLGVYEVATTAKASPSVTMVPWWSPAGGGAVVRGHF